MLPLQRPADGLTRMSCSVKYLILPNGYPHSIRPSAILPLQSAADGPTRKSHTVKYLQIRLLRVKSPAQSLDYRANSYHILLSILGFHGYGEVISRIYPCPFCPINSSFSGTPSPSHHSTVPTPSFWRRRFSRSPGTPTKTSLHRPQSLWSSSLRGDGHQLRCPWGQFIILPLVLLPYLCSSTIYFTEHFPFSFFVLLFTFKTIRICPIKLSSLSINHISNALVR